MSLPDTTVILYITIKLKLFREKRRKKTTPHNHIWCTPETEKRQNNGKPNTHIHTLLSANKCIGEY